MEELLGAITESIYKKKEANGFQDMQIYRRNFHCFPISVGSGLRGD